MGKSNKETQKKWWDAHKEHRAYWNAQERARRRSIPICTREQFFEWYAKNPPTLCACCGIPQEFLSHFPTHNKLELDRLDAWKDIRNSLGYVTGNMTWLCYRCNNTKSDTLTLQELLNTNYPHRARQRWIMKVREKGIDVSDYL